MEAFGYVLEANPVLAGENYFEYAKTTTPGHAKVSTSEAIPEWFPICQRYSTLLIEAFKSSGYDARSKQVFRPLDLFEKGCREHFPETNQRSDWKKHLGITDLDVSFDVRVKLPRGRVNLADVDGISRYARPPGVVLTDLHALRLLGLYPTLRKDSPLRITADLTPVKQTYGFPQGSYFTTYEGTFRFSVDQQSAKVSYSAPIPRSISEPDSRVLNRQEGTPFLRVHPAGFFLTNLLCNSIDSVKDEALEERSFLLRFMVSDFSSPKSAVEDDLESISETIRYTRENWDIARFIAENLSEDPESSRDNLKRACANPDLVLNNGTFSKYEIAFSSRSGLAPADIAKAQSILNSLGFDAGPSDGIAGRRTQSAVAAWQLSKGKPETGQLTRTEYRELLATP